MPKSTLKILYNSLTYPYLNYAFLIWGNTYASHLTPLVILQKRAIRIISKKPYLYPSNELFIDNFILKLEDVINLNLALYIFKNPNYFTPLHNYPTSLGSFPIQNFHRITTTQHSIHFKAPKIWISLPNDIRMSPTKFIFISKSRKYFINRYHVQND